MGWQFYRATLLALKLNRDNGFEDDFYHVNRRLTGKTQVQTYVEKT